MTTLNETGEHLRKTVLRDFGQPRPFGERDKNLSSFRTELSVRDAPLPVLLRYALKLIGLDYEGPWEKVAWLVDFTYKGLDCTLAHQKFGLRLWARIDGTEEDAARVLAQITKKLTSAVRAVETLLAEGAPDTLNAGNVTIANQHYRLRRAYDYFRRRTTNPDLVEDIHETFSNEAGAGSTFTHGASVMRMNASHDLIAAMSAYLSALEHTLVLALPFQNFNPQSDSLTKIIGSPWGDKWKRVIGHADPEAVKLRKRLTDVVERWRNPYSHGGFEKTNGATVFLHTPGVGALPVGMTSIRESPFFSFHSVSETHVEDVFALFGEIDAWLATNKPHATLWIESGQAVRFDAAFRSAVAECIAEDGNLDRLLADHEYRQSQIDNMDFP